MRLPCRFRRQVDLLLNFSERQHKKILAHLRKERWHRAAARHEPVGPPTQAESSLASVVRVPSALHRMIVKPPAVPSQTLSRATAIYAPAAQWHDGRALAAC